MVFRTLSFVLMGNKHFTRQAYERAAQSFDSSVMETSMAGKVVIVTGANSGLGFQASQDLAKRGCKLLMVCRNEARGQEAVEKVKQASGNSDVHLKICDVSSLASVKAFAQEFADSKEPLHVLINNAGVLLNERAKSADGFDASFATSTLGPLVLTQLLQPALLRGAPSKVIFVSSGGMYNAPLDIDDFNFDHMKKWNGALAYAYCKRRQVALTEHLAKEWGSQGIGLYSMHPGWADTEGVRTSIPGFHKTFNKKLRTPAQGADTIVWLALADPSKLEPGAFYLDRAPQQKHLTWGGTHYAPEQVTELYHKLLKVGGLESEVTAAAAASPVAVASPAAAAPPAAPSAAAPAPGTIGGEAATVAGAPAAATPADTATAGGAPVQATADEVAGAPPAAADASAVLAAAAEPTTVTAGSPDAVAAAEPVTTAT